MKRGKNSIGLWMIFLCAFFILAGAHLEIAFAQSKWQTVAQLNPGEGADPPPAIKLTSPVHNQKFPAGTSSIQLQGTVTSRAELKEISLFVGQDRQKHSVQGKSLDLSRFKYDLKKAQGSVNLQIEAVDAQGHKSVVNTVVHIGKEDQGSDNAPPVINLTAPKDGQNVEAGKIPLSGAVTDDRELKTIYIYNGKGYVQHDVSGKQADLSRYSVDLTGQQGKVSVGVYAYDANGKSANKFVSLNIGGTGGAEDRASPVINLISPKEGQTVPAGKVELAGAVTDDVNLKTIYLYNGVRYTAYNVSGRQVDLAGRSVDLTGLAGKVQIGVYAVDASGKTATKFISVNIASAPGGGGDSSAPVINLVSPKEGQTVQAGKVGLAGAVTDDTGLKTIQIYNGVRYTQHNVSGRQVDLADYSIDLSGLAGKISIGVHATDIVGRSASKFISINVGGSGDRLPPSINLTSPKEGQNIRAGKVQLAGTVTDDMALKTLYLHNGKGYTNYNVSGKQIDLSGYSIDLSGQRGKVNIGVYAYDAIGKSSARFISVNVLPEEDKNPPAVNFTSPVNGQTVKEGRLGFSGMVTDDIALRTIYLFDGKGYTPYNVSGKQVSMSGYSVDLAGMKGKQVYVGVYAYDTSNNSTYKFVLVNVTGGEVGKDKKDVEKPAVNISTSNGTKYPSGKPVILKGTITDNVNLRSVHIHNGKAWKTPFKVSGRSVDLSSFPVDMSDVKQSETVTIKVYANDEAGNKSDEKTVTIIYGEEDKKKK